MTPSYYSYAGGLEEPHEAEGDSHGCPAAEHDPRAGPGDGGAAEHGAGAAEGGERGGGERDDDGDAQPVVADEAGGEQRHESADGEGEGGGGGGLDGARELGRLLLAGIAVQLDVALGADGDELADGHAARAGEEAREAGDDHGARVPLDGADAQHQRRRRHQAVVRAKNGGAEPVGALRQVLLVLLLVYYAGPRVLGVHHAGHHRQLVISSNDDVGGHDEELIRSSGCMCIQGSDRIGSE
ncbi:unnamed protein product [Urochloa decumbens]|uniref:Uncharacterized protein n=1 Tax=Urochloa decumbens TaxID=240449 RepID=A0ABC9D0U5_9POAL